MSSTRSSHKRESHKKDKHRSTKTTGGDRHTRSDRHPTDDRSEPRSHEYDYEIGADENEDQEEYQDEGHYVPTHPVSYYGASSSSQVQVNPGYSTQSYQATEQPRSPSPISETADIFAGTSLEPSHRSSSTTTAYPSSSIERNYYPSAFPEQPLATSTQPATYPASSYGASTFTASPLPQTYGYNIQSSFAAEDSCECGHALQGPKKCKPGKPGLNVGSQQRSKDESRSSKASGSRSSKSLGLGSSKHSKKTSKDKDSSSNPLPEPVPGLGPTSGDGSGCFVLDLPVNVTPRQQPTNPGPKASGESQRRYEREYSDWYSEYNRWKDATCRCKHGYFNPQNGEWISGADVRSGKELPNGQWPGGKRPY